MWKRWDLVTILTTKNIKFLSGPMGRPADPKGVWTIVGNLNKFNLVIAKDETIAVIPLPDVRKIASYDINKMVKTIKSVKSKKDLESIRRKK